MGMGQYTLVLITGRHGKTKYGSVGKSDGVIGSKTKSVSAGKKGLQVFNRNQDLAGQGLYALTGVQGVSGFCEHEHR
jgi:hypothetical protein